MATGNSMNMDEAGVQTYNTTTGDLTGSAMTQYAVVCGDANNKIQNVSGVGSSGQVLASNGAGSLPTWQSHPSAIFQPNAVIQEFDDFISSGLDVTAKLNWYNFGNSFLHHAQGVSGHDGILQADTGISSCLLTADAGANSCPFILGSGTFAINWVINIAGLSTAQNRYVLFCGLGDTANGVTDQVNGCYFKYSDDINSGNWNLVTAAASSRTTQATATAVATGWINLGITVNADASSVSFFIDGSQIGSANTTDIPSEEIGALCGFQYLGGTIPANQIDLMYYTRTFTTER
jgi:hypothetical protein